MMKISNKYIILLTGLGHFLVHFVTMILPAILIILENEFEISLTQLGTLVTIQFLFMGIGGLPAGILVDRFGSWKILLIYFLGIALACFQLYYSTSYLSMVTGMAILGLISGLYHPAGLKIVSHAKDISRYMSYHGVFGSLGLATGPVFAAWGSQLLSWRHVYLVVGVMALIGLILTLNFPHETKDRKWPSLKLSISKVHFILFGVSALWGIAHHGVFNFLPYYFSERISIFTAREVSGGLLTGFVLALGIIGQLYGGKLGSKYPRKSLLIWVVGLNIPFLILMTYSWNYPLLFWASLMGAVNFMFQPVSNSLLADVSGKEGRGLIYGISFALSFGVGSLAGVICGYIGEIISTNMIFMSMAGVLIPATILASILKNGLNKS